MTADPATC
uniref:Uncharacterized protein n=1 Tax=Arundo donax TaxID=35708 RepID=A0A0A9ANL3_ARUDO